MDGASPSQSQTAAISGGIRARLAHESGEKHVTGSAAYIDDMPEPRGLLHLYPCLSTRPHARIMRLDLSRVEAASGVHCVVTMDDIPGPTISATADWAMTGCCLVI